MNTHRPRRNLRQLHIERLEQRQLLASDVAAPLLSDSLFDEPDSPHVDQHEASSEITELGFRWALVGTNDALYVVHPGKTGMVRLSNGSVDYVAADDSENVPDTAPSNLLPIDFGGHHTQLAEIVEEESLKVLAVFAPSNDANDQPTADLDGAKDESSEGQDAESVSNQTDRDDQKSDDDSGSNANPTSMAATASAFSLDQWQQEAQKLPSDMDWTFHDPDHDASNGALDSASSSARTQVNSFISIIGRSRRQPLSQTRQEIKSLSMGSLRDEIRQHSTSSLRNSILEELGRAPAIIIDTGPDPTVNLPDPGEQVPPSNDDNGDDGNNGQDNDHDDSNDTDRSLIEAIFTEIGLRRMASARALIKSAGLAQVREAVKAETPQKIRHILLRARGRV